MPKSRYSIVSRLTLLLNNRMKRIAPFRHLSVTVHEAVPLAPDSVIDAKIQIHGVVRIIGILLTRLYIRDLNHSERMVVDLARIPSRPGEPARFPATLLTELTAGLLKELGRKRGPRRRSDGRECGCGLRSDPPRR
jgi:hypothetical protein